MATRCGAPVLLDPLTTKPSSSSSLIPFFPSSLVRSVGLLPGAEALAELSQQTLVEWSQLRDPGRRSGAIRSVRVWANAAVRRCSGSGQTIPTELWQLKMQLHVAQPCRCGGFLQKPAEKAYMCFSFTFFGLTGLAISVLTHPIVNSFKLGCPLGPLKVSQQ